MSVFPTRILLATDGSEDANLALRAAVDIAGKTGSELHVVHAWHSVPSARFKSYIRAQLKKEAQQLLAEQAGRIKDQGGEVAGAHVAEGSAVDKILDLAQELGAGLIVIGSRGLGSVKRLVLGSVSEGVVHHITCPVLVLRGGAGAWPPQKIVIGEDGSVEAKGAGYLAASIGKLFETKVLLLVRAYPKLPEMDIEGRESNARMADDELRREERKLEERAKEVEEGLGIPLRVRLAVGDPASALLEAAEEDGHAERTLIAVGSRGLGVMRRIRLGSVSTNVLRAAKGPVLISPLPRAESVEHAHRRRGL